MNQKGTKPSQQNEYQMVNILGKSMMLSPDEIAQPSPGNQHQQPYQTRRDQPHPSQPSAPRLNQHLQSHQTRRDQPHPSQPSAPRLTSLQGDNSRTKDRAQKFLPPHSTPKTGANHHTDERFISLIRSIINTETAPIEPPAFRFAPTQEAAEWNRSFIISKGGVQQAIDAQTNTPVTYGSEFRPTEILQPLMNFHPMWNNTSTRISNGSTFPLEPLPDELRTADLDSALKYRNHRSTEQNPNFTRGMIDEIKQGWALPLPLPFASAIPDAEVAPHGIITQYTINERGEITNKDRTTHDQSFPGAASGTSVNSRVIDEELMPCLYGHANTRCIHYIVGCRQRHNHTRIWMSKIDWKSAYRRQHLNAISAVKSHTSTDRRNVVPDHDAPPHLRRKPCSSEWGSISEPVTDLATDLLH